MHDLEERGIEAVLDRERTEERERPEAGNFAEMTVPEPGRDQGQDRNGKQDAGEGNDPGQSEGRPVDVKVRRAAGVGRRNGRGRTQQKSRHGGRSEAAK